MHTRLQKFSDFARTLLPHETAWALRIQRFGDLEKTAILERLHHNCTRLDAPLPFDDKLDKRKYSFVKNWLTQKLRDADADTRFEQMSALERKITTDTISPEEEKTLFRDIRRARQTDYFSLKFYDLVQMFRHYLLIRLRHKEHREADLFLKKHREAWLRGKRIYEQLHEATLDIVNQHNAGIAPAGRFVEQSPAVWQQVMAVNVTAPMLLAQAAGRTMLAQGSGKIINVASTSGILGKATLVAYSSSKGALLQFTKALAAWASSAGRSSSGCTARSEPCASTKVPVKCNN